jgi:hypothetical protein
MDKFTQENAAMVEKTATATRALEAEISSVIRAVSSFKLAKSDPYDMRAPSTRAAAPVARLPTPSRGDATARKIELTPDSQNWEEF